MCLLWFIWFISFHQCNRGDTCSTSQQGHFSIVLQYSTPPPPSTTITISPLPSPQKKSSNASNKKKVWIIVRSILLGGLASLTLLSLLVLWVLRCKQTKKIQEMERAADTGETLHMTSVGNTKAPTASHTRTLPTVENEYAPWLKEVTLVNVFTNSSNHSLFFGGVTTLFG
jgi:hypothetical protein